MRHSPDIDYMNYNGPNFMSFSIDKDDSRKSVLHITRTSIGNPHKIHVFHTDNAREFVKNVTDNYNLYNGQEVGW